MKHTPGPWSLSSEGRNAFFARDKSRRLKVLGDELRSRGLETSYQEMELK